MESFSKPYTMRGMPLLYGSKNEDITYKKFEKIHIRAHATR